MSITVRDQGPGLEAARIHYLEGRGESTTAPRLGDTGLGLWIVRRLMEELHGNLKVERPAEGGTIITIAVPFAAAGEIRHVA
jgi:sensor histidine kinase regulating citrate/malate metabolism